MSPLLRRLCGTPRPPRRRSPVHLPASNFPFLIRPAKFQDLGDLADVLTESFHRQDGIARWFAPLFRLGIYEDLRQRFLADAPHYLCLVASDRHCQPIESTPPSQPNYPKASDPQRDRIVGTIEVAMRSPNLWQSRTTRYLYISNLAVQPSYRRLGIAYQLLTACEKVAKDWGFVDLYLHVLENNAEARQLYQKLGYRIDSKEFSPMLWLFRRPPQLFLRKRLR